ncbi:histidine phosphatase family protein [Rossellomorea sp. AcN35-11]|nr:histidine phosphatase family protein [Rossellomorea aquimaris]WJV28431.1 histidine phosphatase family protein [Rossellomorea sp. AcN35-11]
MTHLCLVRHGQTNWNLHGKLQGQTDIPLNENGKLQAEECREYLKMEKWDVLITTSLMRASKTADIINEALDLDIVLMDQFKERFFGLGEGLSREEREKNYPAFIFPEMETYNELVDRVQGGLREIQLQFPDKKVLVVAHGAVISAILREFLEEEKKSEHLKLFNGCLSHLHFKNNRWSVHSYNEVGLLSEHA